MPVRFSDPRDLISPKAVAQMLQILFTCAALGLSRIAANGGSARDRGFSTFALFTWCFSFICTLLVFAVEFTQVHSLFPLTWKNLSVAVSAFAGLMNLATSVSYPLMVANASESPLCSQAGTCTWTWTWTQPLCAYDIAAIACSCLASFAYAAEVFMSRSSRRNTYMATGPGLLKVLQVSIACILSVPLATGQIPAFPGFWWAVGALCACAFISLVVMVMVVECRACCPVPLERLLAAFGILGVLLSGALLVVWTLGFSKQDDQTACRWKLCLSSAVLISLNFLAYVSDLVHAVKLNCSRN
ncbi:myeloid-associated differentiation marker homolog [Hypanus sabinus]|uniref:myeloid-associated differentiation marker homolog n=1 Tax=Hypanus sabinus TaxID=79690 RepID=UPI0028C4F562|nr:myeloid-associated differentiation marker homolog [Hypanus sabinus]